MSLTLPHLFGPARLREIVLPYPRQTLRLLAIEDPWGDAERLRDTPDGEIYWAELWPSAVALSQLLLDGHLPVPRASEPVLEMGCGAGLVSVAAAIAHPGISCIASDRERRGVLLAGENARRNGVADRVEARVLDWRAPYPRRHPAVLAADCLYHVEACAELASFIDRALSWEKGARAYVADPIRESARGFRACAEKLGFQVERMEIHVPFLLARGPVYRFGPLQSGQAYESMAVHLYALTR